MYNGEFSLEQSKAGNYEPSYSQYEIIVHGLPTLPQFILIDGEKIELKRNFEHQTCRFISPTNFKKIKIYNTHLLL